MASDARPVPISFAAAIHADWPAQPASGGEPRDEHGQEQAGHHQVLPEGGVPARAPVELPADQVDPEVRQHQRDREAGVERPARQVRELARTETHRGVRDDQIEAQPHDVDDVLYAVVRPDHREDELPGQVGAQRDEGHAVGPVGDATPDDENVGQRPEQPGADGQCGCHDEIVSIARSADHPLMTY